MPAKHYRGFYEGFANSALWPALHSRPDLIRVTARIMRRIARSTPSWRGRCCVSAGRKRSSGCRIIISSRSAPRCAGLQIGAPIGFFLHTPWADRRTMVAVPRHAELVHAMLSYDLIGFQTDEDRQNFEDYLQHELGLTVFDGTVASSSRTDPPGHFPDRHRCR